MSRKVLLKPDDKVKIFDFFECPFFLFLLEWLKYLLLKFFEVCYKKYNLQYISGENQLFFEKSSISSDNNKFQYSLIFLLLSNKNKKKDLYIWV